MRAGDRACERLFANVDGLVAGHDVDDPGAYRIPDFPYLRTDRFLASFRDEVRGGPRLAAWVGRLADRDRQGRRYELANLPRGARAGLPDDIGARLDGCRARLVERDLVSPARRRLLRRNARAPDEVSLWKRVLGIYPISSLFVSFRIKSLQYDLMQGHRAPLSRLRVEGRLRHWGRLPAGDDMAHVDVPWPVDALGIPRPDGRRLEALFRRHAPLWEVDERDANDRATISMPGRSMV